MSLSSLRDSTSKYKTDVICSEPRGYVKLCWLTILKIKKLTHIYILKYMHSYNQLRVEAQYIWIKPKNHKEKLSYKRLLE